MVKQNNIHKLSFENLISEPKKTLEDIFFLKLSTKVSDIKDTRMGVLVESGSRMSISPKGVIDKSAIKRGANYIAITGDKERFILNYWLYQYGEDESLGIKLKLLWYYLLPFRNSTLKEYICHYRVLFKLLIGTNIVNEFIHDFRNNKISLDEIFDGKGRVLPAHYLSLYVKYNKRRSTVCCRYYSRFCLYTKES